MKRVLLVAYYFPPLAGSGTFRPLRMARYLPRAGWDVTVLSVSSSARVLKDPDLASEIPGGVAVVRTASLEPRTPLLALHKLGLGRLARRLEPWFLLPDDQRGWVPFAAGRAAALHRARPFDAIVTTAGPYSAHLVGRRLKRRAGLPWVADFRDEWTTNPYLRDRYPSAWHLRVNQRLERSVLRGADRVVCVSEPWLEALRSLVPEAPDGKFRVHPNGFDPEHFPAIPAAPPPRFRIVYTGTFYGHRSPATFLEGLKRVIAAGRIPVAELSVELVGHTGFGDFLEGVPAGVVRVVEQRPFREALARLAEAAVLLLVIPREGGPGNHTGKLFNYLAAGRPILALAPEPNVAADLIRESRSGLVVPPDDPDAVARAIEELWRRYRSGVLLPDRDAGVVRAYAADAQAESYAAMLDEITGLPRPPRASR